MAATPSLLSALTHVQWPWALSAGYVEFVSVLSLARSQRRLLQVDGDRVSRRSAIGVVLAGNALSQTIPVAGMGMSAAFSFRHFRRGGVRPATVGWALTVSNAMSSLTFALLMTAGAVLSGQVAALVLGVGGAVLNAAPVLALLAALRFEGARRLLVRLVGATLRLWAKVRRRPFAGTAAFEEFLQRAGSVRATRRQYALATAHAFRNWSLDCVCLAMAVEAVGGPLPARAFVLVYCTGMMAGGLGLVPGGLGVVDATLLAGLVGAGLPAAKALPAVVLYRVISLGLVVLTGWVVAVLMNRRAAPEPVE